MLIQTIATKGQFRDQFANLGRENNFSYEALGLLFDYFNDIDTPIEFDVIGICCEFNEMDEDEIKSNYSLEEDVNIEEYLSYNTCLIGITKNGTYVFSAF